MQEGQQFLGAEAAREKFEKKESVYIHLYIYIYIYMLGGGVHVCMCVSV